MLRILRIKKQLFRILLFAGSLVFFLPIANDIYAQDCDGSTSYFLFEDLTGDNYAIILDFSVDDCELAPCDEIGIFAGDICVGAVVYDGRQLVPIVAWADDQQTPEVDGYHCNQVIQVRLWRHLTNEVEILSYTSGDSDEVNFCNGAYAILVIQRITTGISDNENDVLPLQWNLLQNSPNPFNLSTTISFTLSRTSPVTVKVVNLLGQTVNTLVDKEQLSGEVSIEWDGRNENGEVVTTGIYFCMFEHPGGVEYIKMLLLK